MKLLRYQTANGAKPGLLDATGAIRDLSAHVSDFGGDSVKITALDKLRDIDPESLPQVEGAPQLASCVSWTPNFHCIGLNYGKHADETGMPRPTEPILFNKASSALTGPFDPVMRPKGSEKLDYEVELGVVIGAEVEHVSGADALSVVAGYCVINDVSEREFQIERGGQWVKGKSAPSFGPTGPWIVTPDEVADPQNLRCWLSVNGEMRQDSNTSDMIFGVAEIISYMSRFMRLMPGDLIATGTPEGVGMGLKPQKWLSPGDEIALGIEGLGEQKQTVVEFGA